VSEYDGEPVRGLPEALPEGEHILWQGSPDWKDLAKQAFHVRAIAVYFALLIGWALVSATMVGTAMTVVVAALALALVSGLGWLSATTTIYTITNKRVVMRYGMVLQKCVNLPFTAIGSAGVAVRTGGHGDIPLELADKHALGYLQFWPHARAWHVNNPQPMLRSIPEAARVAALLGDALRSAKPRTIDYSSPQATAPLEALAA
jgi:Bacterial PH domain